MGVVKKFPMSQQHILFERCSLGAKSTKDNEHFKDLQNVGFPGQDPKGQKVPSKKIRLSGSFGRTCLLRPVILILESPEKCVKPQISVPQPQTSSFSGSVQRPSICTCHTSSDGAAAPTPGTAQGTMDLLPVQ